METSKAEDWRVCIPPDGPIYYYHLPTATVVWALPHHIEPSRVLPFTEEDEAAVDEDNLVSAEEAARAVQVAVVTNHVDAANGSTESANPAANTRSEGATVDLNNEHDSDPVDAPGLPADFDIVQVVDALDTSNLPVIWKQLHEMCGNAVFPKAPAFADIHASMQTGYCAGSSACASWIIRQLPGARSTEDDVYYVNTLTGEQSWVRPQEFFDAEALKDPSSVLESLGSGMTVGNYIAAVGLHPLQPAIEDNLNALRAYKTRVDAGIGVDPPDIMPLFRALLHLEGLIDMCNFDSVKVHVAWADALADSENRVVSTLGSILLNPVTPPAVSLCCIRILCAIAAVTSDVFVNFIDGSLCTFPDLVACIFRGFAVAVYARPIFHAIDRSALRLRDKNSQKVADPEAFVAWLRFALAVTSYAALSPGFVVSEPDLEWTQLTEALLYMVGDAGPAEAEVGGAPLSSPKGVASVMLHCLRFVACLHRLFERAVLTEGEAHIEDATCTNVESAMLCFGVITPVIQGFANAAKRTFSSAALLTLFSSDVVLMLNTSGHVYSTLHNKSWSAAQISPRFMTVSALSLLHAVLLLPSDRQWLYKNDLQVLLDLVLRELQDLPATDLLRVCYLYMLKVILWNTQWSEEVRPTRRYRFADVVATLTKLFDSTQAAATGLLPAIREAAQHVLLACRDVLEDV